MNTRTLMVIVAVVVGLFIAGVLSPAKVRQLQCHWRQREAKTNLEEARARLNAKAVTEGRILTFGELAWAPKGAPPRYEYEIKGFGRTNFAVEARAIGPEMNGDVWIIDDDGTLKNSVDGCSLPR